MITDKEIDAEANRIRDMGADTWIKLTSAALDKVRSVEIPATGWQPFSTIPRDGTKVLLCWLHTCYGPGHIITVGYVYDGVFECWGEKISHIEKHCDSSSAQHMWTRDVAIQGGVTQPTHWQPLPTPPSLSTK